MGCCFGLVFSFQFTCVRSLQLKLKNLITREFTFQLKVHVFLFHFFNLIKSF